MEFLIETLKNASLHIHAVWLAIAYIAVIVTQAMEFMAKKQEIESKRPTINFTEDEQQP